MKRLTVSLLVTAAAFAQHEHSPAPAAEKPVALYTGLGSSKHAIRTSSPEAQKYFDQGLTLMYSFNRYEALRSFRKAAELDPHAAMAQWGIAMALGPYLNMDMDMSYQIKESCDAAAAGLALPDLTAGDRMWLEAAATRCPGYADPKKYIEAMRVVASRLPDDPDAQTLYAEALIVPVRWHCYDTEGKPVEGVREAEQVLESVLRRYPNHPGANHLYIHTVEASPNPERAIASSYRLMGIVPAAGHMVHMPGHIWLVLGDYNNAVAVNERAVEADRKYFEQTGVIGSYYPYYLHNLQFILYSRTMQGRRADARVAAKQFLAAVEPVSKTMPEMAGAFSALATLAKLRIGLWDEVLAIGKPATEDPLALAMWRFSRAAAFCGEGKLSEARQEQAQFEEHRKKVDPNIPWDTNKTGDVMNLASAELAARLEESPALAAGKWEKAVAIQDSLVYGEPPAWYYPLRESLGAALLRSGDAAAAEQAFREGSRRSPNNGRMLFGLLESLKAQHKDEAAAWVQTEFESAWNGADVVLRLKDL